MDEDEDEDQHNRFYYFPDEAIDIINTEDIIYQESENHPHPTRRRAGRVIALCNWLGG